MVIIFSALLLMMLMERLSKHAIDNGDNMAMTRHFDYSKHFFERLSERASSKDEAVFLVRKVEEHMRDKCLEMAFTSISRGDEHAQAFLVNGFVVRYKWCSRLGKVVILTIYKSSKLSSMSRKVSK